MRLIRRLTGPVLDLPELATVTVRVSNILSELITVYVVSRVRRLRLASFVGHVSVMAIIRGEERSGSEVRRLVRDVLAARRLSRSLEVVRCQPNVVPDVALYGNVAPLREVREERGLTVLRSTARRIYFLVGRLLVVRHALNGELRLLDQLSRDLARLVSTPIVMDVFRNANCALVSLRVM